MSSEQEKAMLFRDTHVPSDIFPGRKGMCYVEWTHTSTGDTFICTSCESPIACIKQGYCLSYLLGDEDPVSHG